MMIPNRRDRYIAYAKIVGASALLILMLAVVILAVGRCVC